jgi:hypothetical protein
MRPGAAPAAGDGGPCCDCHCLFCTRSYLAEVGCASRRCHRDQATVSSLSSTLELQGGAGHDAGRADCDPLNHFLFV